MIKNIVSIKNPYSPPLKCCEIFFYIYIIESYGFFKRNRAYRKHTQLNSSTKKKNI